MEAGTDNRNIVDDGKSQKLTRDDIEALKEKGLKGQVHVKLYNFTFKCVRVLPIVVILQSDGKNYFFFHCKLDGKPMLTSISN